MNSKLQDEPWSRTLFFRATLPALAPLCDAFPLLVNSCLDLLLKV